jgi:DNA (cytosine-5)-methyltransferase 1
LQRISIQTIGVKMKHGSLFSGIGGFDLAAQWCGWENVFQCEIDPFCQKVLRYHFPKTKLYEDITTTNFKEYMGKIDIISGGFPCQPFSQIGRGLGSNDDRHLWFKMFEVIWEVLPQWVVAENVCRLLTIEKGMVFESIIADLETTGYDVQTFIIPACSLNAPHRRDRLWIIAHCPNARLESLRLKRATKTNRTGAVADTGRIRLEERAKEETPHIPIDTQRIHDWRTFPTQQPIYCGDDGLSERLDGITLSRWNNNSIKTYGNAIVPQIAYQIFKTINEVQNA